jgi:hypothetical protein
MNTELENLREVQSLFTRAEALRQEINAQPWWFEWRHPSIGRARRDEWHKLLRQVNRWWYDNANRTLWLAAQTLKAEDHPQ